MPGFAGTFHRYVESGERTSDRAQAVGGSDSDSESGGDKHNDAEEDDENET